ncbi:MAG TPA: AzlC family ABC transporter permease [Clostridiales bacterium]|nr:AzlC family ABC transporter permease [Clostridiales bacterium]
MYKKIKQGFIAVLPIVIGYFPIAIGFGLLSKNTGISFKGTSLHSIMVFAGASQFMSLDLIKAGVGTGGIILATFLLNLRHIMMSASLSVNFKNIERKYLPLIAFGITDETFSVASFNKDKINLPFILTVNILAYTSWVSGTIVGFLVGETLPKALQSSLDIGLYAMFAALLFPEFNKHLRTFIIALLAAIIYMGLYYSELFSPGWDIIIGIVLSAVLGTFVFKNKDTKEEKL